MMTTITSRSLPLIPLPIPLSQMLHPENNLLLHSTTSPPIPLSENRMSPQSQHDSNTSSPRLRMQSCDSRLQEDRRSVLDEMSEARSSPMSSIQTDNYHKDDDHDDEDDRMSGCSEDSELSVGKEDGVERTQSDIRYNNTVRSEKLERRSSLDTTVEDMSNDSSRFSQRLPQLSKEDVLRFPLVRPSPTRFQEEFLRSSQLYAEELMKQQMSIVAAARGITFNGKTVTPVVENPSTLRRNFETESPPKIGFRPHIRVDDRASRSPPESMNFRGIHSHLNAISQITQNLNHNIQKITSPSLSSMTSRESSQSPPSNNNHHQMGLHNLNHHNHHHHLNHHHHHMMMNNNLNDSNLKFSIDNILKADFGRRITEPLKRTKTKKHSKNNSNSGGSGGGVSAAGSGSGGVGGIGGTVGSVTVPIDLTAAQEKNSPTNQISNSSNNNNNNNNRESIGSNGSVTSNDGEPASSSGSTNGDGPMVWPAWVYCTRYSDRPSSGPRTRRPKKPPGEKITPEDKRPRTAFSGPQLARLKHEFNENRYLTERRRQALSSELGLNEAQIKIWFQNKRAKIKKSSGQKNPLALQLMAQGLYNHSTVPLTREEEELQALQEQARAEAENV